jgi:hypothetical protein
MSKKKDLKKLVNNIVETDKIVLAVKILKTIKTS